MYGRVQTWFPFNLQIGINGRECGTHASATARQMDRAGLKYRQPGNGFVWIEDYAQAQKLMDQPRSPAMKASGDSLTKTTPSRSPESWEREKT